MKAMFPIGVKIKKFNEKINVTAQLQSIFEKEFNKYYIPLKKEPFEESKKNKVKQNKTKKNQKKIK
jgi:hypothetical protein